MVIGYLYGFIASFLMGMYGIFIKDLYKNNLSQEIIYCGITFFALIFNIILLFIKNKKPLVELKLNKKQFLFSIINGDLLCLFLTGTFSLIAFKYIDNGIQRALVYSSPIYIIAMQYIFFKKKINFYEILASVLIIFGLVLIIKKINPLSNTNILLGVIFGILSCLCFSIYSVATEHIKIKINQEVYWIFAYLTAFILTLISMIFKNKLGDFSNVLNIKILINLFICSILLSVLPYSLVSKSIKIIGAIKINIILAFTPIIAMATGIIILKEQVTIIQTLGFIFIIIACLISNKN